jgi:hypothetical protein
MLRFVAVPFDRFLVLSIKVKKGQLKSCVKAVPAEPETAFADTEMELKHTDGRYKYNTCIVLHVL